MHFDFETVLATFVVYPISMSNGILHLVIQWPKVGDTESHKQISNGAGSNTSAIHFGRLHLLKVTKYVLVLRD